jgi:hypothetical protein
LVTLPAHRGAQLPRDGSLALNELNGNVVCGKDQYEALRGLAQEYLPDLVRDFRFFCFVWPWDPSNQPRIEFTFNLPYMLITIDGKSIWKSNVDMLVKYDNL